MGHYLISTFVVLMWKGLINREQYNNNLSTLRENNQVDDVCVSVRYVLYWPTMCVFPRHLTTFILRQHRSHQDTTLTKDRSTILSPYRSYLKNLEAIDHRQTNLKTILNNQKKQWFSKGVSDCMALSTGSACRINISRIESDPLTPYLSRYFLLIVHYYSELDEFKTATETGKYTGRPSAIVILSDWVCFSFTKFLDQGFYCYLQSSFLVSNLYFITIC